MNIIRNIILLLACALTLVCLEGCASSRPSNTQYYQGIEKVGNKYVLYKDVDLRGGEMTLPKGYVLSIKQGAINNGTVKGSGNKIEYRKPFIGEHLVIEGCYVEDKMLRSESVLVKNSFSNLDIHNVYGLAREGTTAIFEKGTYKEVTQIDIDKSITIDFSNATIETALDRYDLSSPVFMTEAENAKRLKRVCIKNVVIDGQKPYSEQTSVSGQRRNAIRLLNIRNVILKNVTIKNFCTGTGGYYARNVKDRYMEGVCNVSNYKRCDITNCYLSRNTGEGFFLVPGVSNNNYTLFKSNRSYNNRGTLLTLVDGQCLVEDNEMDGFGYSGMNVFCYNSVIRNNHFIRGERFNCIDITENGLYWPRNVEIYGNKAEDCEGFIMAAGENISIERNKCKIPKSAFALTIFGYMPTDEDSPAYLIQRKDGNGVARIKIKNNEWVCKGGIATYKGCKGMLNIEGNIITIVPNEEGKPHRGSALELNDCRSIIIENNIFKDSFRNASSNSNIYITMNECSGVAIINNNFFTQTVSSPDKSTFFLYTQSSFFEQLTIEGNSSDVNGIGLRSVEGMLPVSGKRLIRNNRGIDIHGVVEKKID